MLVRATDVSTSGILASKTTNTPAAIGTANDSLVFIATGGTTTISFTDTSSVTLNVDTYVDNVVAEIGACTHPGGIFGAELWVKANSTGLQANGSNQVEQWLNSSGSFDIQTHLRAAHPAHTNAITPTNDILRVANGINFNPAIDFSGASGRTLKGNAVNQWDTTPVSIYSVALPEGTTAGGFGGVWTSLSNWTTGAANTAGLGLLASGTSNYSLDGNGCSTGQTSSPVTEPRVVRGVYTNGANQLGGSTWLNGVQEGAGTSCGTNATTLFEVGGRTAGDPVYDNRVFNGKITEVVVYKSVLSAANANKVESYLAVKYGITLRQTPAPQNYTASDGTVFWNAALNTIYNKNIAGIGRDDLSGLSQKQSRSVNVANSGNLVTIGLGTIGADNLSNPNEFIADGDFLTWGDDSASASFSTPITPPVGVTATVRMTRIWKTQETGTVGTVKVGSPSSLGGGNTVYLVVSNDTTFDAADQYIPMTPHTGGTTTYQAADFDFTTGQFFTFASIPAIPGGVGGMALWLKGDAGMSCETDNCTVTQWQDQSPNGKNANVAGGTLSRFNAGVNFNPSLRFDDNEYMTGASLFGTATFNNANIYIVSRKLSIGSGAADFRETLSGTDRVAIYQPFTDNAVYWDAGNGVAPHRLSAPAGTIILNQFELKSYNASTTAGQTHGGSIRQAIVRNGRLITSDTDYASYTGANNTYALGSDGTPLTGSEDIAELIVFTSPITGAQQQQIQSYLALKYGITLDQTTPQNYIASDGTTISWDATANVTFNKNIAGIGRDDVSALNQKQSRSINLPGSGNLVTMGLGTIAADNDSNPNVFAADKNFLTWGDDGGAEGFNTLITSPAGILATVRTTRIWKVQETGTVGTVKIGIPSNLGGGNTVYLVVSNDTTFDAGDQYIPMTPHVAGSTVYQAADFDFLTGQFFAFATLPAIPGGVAAPATWQKANDGASTGALWKDSSAGGNDAVQPVAASQPTFVPGSDAAAINYNPAFDFDGFNDALLFDNTLGVEGLNDFSSLVVLKQDTAATGTYFGNNDGQGNFIATIDATGAYGTLRGGVGTGTCNSLTTTTLPLGVPGIGSYVRASQNVTGQLNGGGTVSGVCNQSFDTVPRLLGRRNQGGVGQTFFNGKMSEFIHYDRVLTANELQRIHSYLAIKYGATLDQTTPTDYLASDSTIIWNAAANAVYNRDIAGIGRDDVSALEQKQSASVNPGNFVTIGHGGIAPDNETNPNNFPADKDFLIWGHDGAVTTFNFPVTGTALTRMPRVWKVQETAGIPFAPIAPESVGNVVVSVPASLFTNPLPTLIRSADATFDVNDTLIPMTLNGSNYEATIDFGNGDFFTFAQSVSPTSANVNISGRVVTGSGMPIANAKVILMDSQGVPRAAMSSSYGYYRFEEVPAGESYVLTVLAKRYQFTPQVVTVNEEIADLIITAIE